MLDFKDYRSNISVVIAEISASKTTILPSHVDCAFAEGNNSYSITIHLRRYTFQR